MNRKIHRSNSHRSQEYHSISHLTPRLKVLVVIPSDGNIRRRSLLVRRLEDGEVEVLVASNCSEAYSLLDMHSAVNLIFATLRLPDGDWRKLLTAAIRKGLNPQLVLYVPRTEAVSVNLEGGFWALLVEPYKKAELEWIITSATDALGRLQETPESSDAKYA